MEIAIPILVIIFIFIAGLVNKAAQSAHKNQSDEPEMQQEEYDVAPTYESYEQSEEASLESIDQSTPFSYDDQVEPEAATIQTLGNNDEARPTEYVSPFNNYIKGVAPTVTSDIDAGEIGKSDISKSNSERGDDSNRFDGRKAVIYSEIIKPKYN